jgi:hypothetical protein
VWVKRAGSPESRYSFLAPSFQVEPLTRIKKPMSFIRLSQPSSGLALQHLQLTVSGELPQSLATKLQSLLEICHSQRSLDFINPA